MKLRIRGNSLRLRLSQPETREIAEGRAVADSIGFGGGARLSYRLRPQGSDQPAASFAQGEIEVTVPEESARQWARSEQVSLEAHQPLDDGSVLSILIEKDFSCLKPRAYFEDESELFPNPGHSCGAPSSFDAGSGCQ